MAPVSSPPWDACAHSSQNSAQLATAPIVASASRANSLALAGSAKDFPYPPEPPAVEPGPKLG